MDMILLAFVMAITVEGIVEYAKSIAEAFSAKEHKTAVTQMTACAVSVLLCLCVGVDVYGAMGIVFNVPYVGVVLTGVFASRGSNYLSDFVKKLQSTKGA